MADLGAVGRPVWHSLIQRILVQPVAVRRATSELLPTDADNQGKLSGTVAIGGVPAPNVRLALYFRDNGALLARTISGADGSYSFIGLNRGLLGRYQIVATDPASDAPLNYTLAHDHLTAGTTP